MTVARRAAGHRSAPAAGVPRCGPWQTALAILRRDLFVTGREFPIFLAQVILQPLFLLFVFGKVLTELGLRAARLRAGPLSGTGGPRRGPHRPPVDRAPPGHRVLLQQRDRGPPARTAADRRGRRREGGLRGHAGLRGRGGDVPDRGVDPRLDPLAGVGAVRRGGDDHPRGAARRRDGTHPRHLRPAQPDQRDLRAGADPAHLHRFVPVPVAVARRRSDGSRWCRPATR